jgi:hypothetical protein
LIEIYGRSALEKDWTPGEVVGMLNGDVLRRRDGTVLPGYSSLPEGLRNALTRSLRSLVDRWIDSGRGADGVDAPLSRTVYWLPGGDTLPLCDVLLAWNRRHAEQLHIQPSGQRAISLGKPKAESPKKSWVERLSEFFYDPQPENEYEASEIAIYWLQELLESPGSKRIARCDNPGCRQPYYLRERVRTKITRGTYCNRCASAGSIARVKANRERRRRELVESAADTWDAFRPSRRYPRKSDWVALKVTERTSWAIKGKWVTQNQKAIEAEVERRKHGTV